MGAHKNNTAADKTCKCLLASASWEVPFLGKRPSPFRAGAHTTCAILTEA